MTTMGIVHQNHKYRIRIINGDFWSVDDGPEIYQTLPDALSAVEEFLDDIKGTTLKYYPRDIEIVTLTGYTLSVKHAKRLIKDSAGFR